MNLTSSIRVAFEDLRTLAFGGITGAYAEVGTSFQNPVRQLIIHNDTDVNMLISYDGTSNKSWIAAGTSRILDYGSNAAKQAGFFEQPAYQGVWVKAEAGLPSAGNVHVEVIYASQN